MAQFSARVEKALIAARSEFILFLRSDDGKRLLVDLLIEALARNEVAPVLNGAETRLKALAADAEISLQASAAALADRVHQDVQGHLRSYRANMAETVGKQLRILLEEEIARPRRGRSGPDRSNRELARDYGVSIRQVKRLRRRRAFGKTFQRGATVLRALTGRFIFDPVGFAILRSLEWNLVLSHLVDSPTLAGKLLFHRSNMHSLTSRISSKCPP
jgi:hypothetical protein